MNKNLSKVIMICLLLLVGALIVVISNNKKNYDNTSYKVEDIFNYDSNQYMEVIMNEQDVVSIYLNEYINNTNNNVEEAYKSLNEEYRLKKFESIDNYKDYLNNTKLSNDLLKYGRTVINGYIIFDCIDRYGNRYLIKEKSIMNYEIYLDDYTVEIK